MPFLEVNGLTKAIGTSFRLEPIDLVQAAGQRLAIAGATGSGKSTLLKLIAGLAQPDAGTVHLESARVLGADEKLLPGHPRIAYLSQHYELRHHYRVEELLEYANKLPYREALWIYDVCRITHLLQRKEHELSGGEKQRVATARLLIQQPALLLLDEPFSNLDRAHKTVMQQVLHDIGSELGITCLLVTHDPLDSLSWAEEILVLQEGRRVQQAAPQLLYRQPANEYVAGLFGPYNLFSPGLADAFAGTMALPASGRKALLRPEHLRLAPVSEPGARGIIQRLRYFGAHWEADVLVGNATLTVHCAQEQWRTGDEVSVVPQPDTLWFL
ncbi:ABC transporter ATP-binding protein [Flaviaesturariibacter amylovorans]|uniref:ABC transporter ATP-binding protein n=1 Tax=Flaviaesturariibacter amylovorans TaxID=1084520 RepID=A0ABP8GIC1_9BACT